MKKVLLLGVTLIMLVLPATSAFAVGNTLNWGGCIGAGQQSDQTFDCANPNAEYRLVMSVQPPAVAGFFAVDIILDLQIGDASLNPFWFMQEFGCNHSGLSISADPSQVSSTGCLTSITGPNGGSVSSDLPQYGAGFHGANRARIILSVFRSPYDPIDLTADADYFLSYLIFRMANATEAGGTCSGCSVPAAIVFQQLVFYNFSGPPIEIEHPGLGSNCATVNGGGPGWCAATPTRNRTWGEIKSLYR